MFHIVLLVDWLPLNSFPVKAIMIEYIEYSFSMKSFVLTVSLLLLTSAELIKINGSDYSSVKVSGHGDTYDTPDIAKFSLTVRELRNTSK